MQPLTWLVVGCLLTGCRSSESLTLSQPSSSLAEMQESGRRFNAVVRETPFPLAGEEIVENASNALAKASAGLDRIARRDPNQRTVGNTLGAIDDIEWELELVGRELALIMDASTNAGLRKTASESLKAIECWGIDADFRQDVYEAVRFIGETQPLLQGEDARLLQRRLQEYRRFGLGRPPSQIEKLNKLWKELAGAELEFRNNLNAPPAEIQFSRAELLGIPGRYWRGKQVRGTDTYVIKADPGLIGYAAKEATRKRLWLGCVNRVANQNTPLLKRILECRRLIALELGYACWADYVGERTMAGGSAVARSFCEDLLARSQAMFEAEIGQLTQLKVKDTANSNARIQPWDLDYYMFQVEKQSDTRAVDRLWRYFRSDRVMAGMVRVCERIFGLKIEAIKPSAVWAEGVRLYAVSDSHTGEPLGLIYLLISRRIGENDENAERPLVPGKELPDGRRQCPVAVIQMHLTGVSLAGALFLSHREVCTLFHEFGHALNDVLSRSKFSAFAGTKVTRDFVEVQSILLEQWPWDERVLETFAGKYGRPSQKIPPALSKQLMAERRRWAGIRYRQSLAWALMDIALHTESKPNADALKLANEVYSKTFLPLPEAAAPGTGASALVNYGATGYAFLWSEAIVTDILTVARSAPDGLLDQDSGLRLRREIYEPGDTRDAKDCVERFLGRPYSAAAFLKQFGDAD